MNILICSVGRRVKLVQYFKEEFHKINGKVIGVDCDITAPAMHHTDKFEVVPRITHPDYLITLLNLCEKHNIKGILSLIDPELSFLAKNKDEFEKKGVMVVGSQKEIVDICFNKYSTYQFLKKHDIPSIPTYIDIDEVMRELENRNIKFPVIVKPNMGSASLGIMKITTMDELKALQNEDQDLIFQPFIEGEEYGVDCYIDCISNNVTNIFMKRKITMRAGETDKSISVFDLELKELIEHLIARLQPTGPIDIDCFKTKEGFVISEINPRFGGGYPHAHEMGQNFVINILNNLKGVQNDKVELRYKDGTTMIKFDQILVI